MSDPVGDTLRKHDAFLSGTTTGFETGEQGFDHETPLMDEHKQEMDKHKSPHPGEDNMGEGGPRVGYETLGVRRGLLCCSLCLTTTCLGALGAWAYYQNEYRKTFKDAKCEYFEVDTPMQIEFYGACIACVALMVCMPTLLCLHNSAFGLIPCGMSGCGIVVGFLVMMVGSTYMEISVDCDPIQKTGPCAEKCPDVYDDIKLYYYMMGGFWSFFTVFLMCMTGVICMEASARMQFETEKQRTGQGKKDCLEDCFSQC